MTALNVILRPEVAFVVTDGEARIAEAEGGLALPRPKMLPLPHLNGALALRGSSTLLTVLYMQIVGARASFAEAVDHLGEDLKAFSDRVRQNVPDLVETDLVLVGFPDQLSAPPECHVVTDHAKYGPGPFVVASTDCIASPNDGTLLSRLGGRNLFLPDVPFDPEADAVALIRAQTAMPGSDVGAFVQLTIIRRDRIETRIVKWFELSQKPGPSRRG